MPKLAGWIPAWLIFTLPAYAQQLAFPGAEGFGRFAKGGRGGEVYHVTKLADAGYGSFRDAVSKPNRTVVFDVGGLITISSRIVVSANIYLAGQTAPGEGVSVYGNGISFSNADNAIVRYLRFRMGVQGEAGKDGITIAEGHDMIFDHVSVSWGRDETFSVSGTGSNITVQDCIIAQGLQTHSCGGLMQTNGGLSILRTLYIDNHTRNPKVKGVNQFVNNVIYNWEVAAYIQGDSDSDSFVNVNNNYFIDGPGTGEDAFTRGNLNFHIYASGNFQDGNKNGRLDGAMLPKEKYGIVDWQSKPYDYPPIALLTPQAAYDQVVAKAGASLRRDPVDLILVSELTSLGTKGKTISSEMDLPTKGPGGLLGGLASLDSDQDGIPNAWEKSHGMDANNALDRNGDNDHNGYTNLEEFLNDLSGTAANIGKHGALPSSGRTGFNALTHHDARGKQLATD
jgi:pectate lyase